MSDLKREVPDEVWLGTEWVQVNNKAYLQIYLTPKDGMTRYIKPEEWYGWQCTDCQCWWASHPHKQNCPKCGKVATIRADDDPAGDEFLGHFDNTRPDEVRAALVEALKKCIDDLEAVTSPKRNIFKSKEQMRTFVYGNIQKARATLQAAGEKI